MALAQSTPQRNVYWGEQHVHTSLSLDAYVFGNTVSGPEDFYRYALGKPITHPGGFEVQITKSLDWGAVTEHSDYMGLVQLANDPQSPLRKSSGFMSGLLRFGLDNNALLTFQALSAAVAFGHSIDAFTRPGVLAPVWDRVVQAADKYYLPGKFTTFAAFEWTSTPDSNNLHRNVFFRDSGKVPALPYTSLASMNPIDLWTWMDEQRAAGNEVLAVSPNDEFASYEVLEWQLLGAMGKPQIYGSYIRQAYRDGLVMRKTKGFNPYRFGIVGGSDSHVTAAPYRQENYFGVHGRVDDTVEERVSGAAIPGLSSLSISPAGLSAVWAEENTRESIFAGLQRKEVYATSGTRIGLRFFGGWDYGSGLLEHPGWSATAYGRGVPMGGELPRGKGGAPTFAICATRDPDSANLDRIQVVKGWSTNGQSFEKIYDVAWAGERSPDPKTGRLPAIGSTVDLITGKYTDTLGSAELKTVWVDSDFDPDLDAFYYVRVLEIPTPRWSTIQAAQLGWPAPSGQGFTPAVQERAWSSPIWYIASPGSGQPGSDALRASERR